MVWSSTNAETDLIVSPESASSQASFPSIADQRIVGNDSGGAALATELTPKEGRSVLLGMSGGEPFDLVEASTVQPDADNGLVQQLTTSTSFTLDTPTNMNIGEEMTIYMISNGAVLTAGINIRSPDGTTPVLSGSGEEDTVKIRRRSTTVFDLWLEVSNWS